MLTYTVNLNAQFNNLYSNFVGYGLKIITPSDFGVIIGDNMQTQSALAFGTPYYNSFTKLQIFNTNYPLYNGTATIYILQSTSEEFPLASPVTIGTGSNPIQVTSITDPINVNQIASAVTVSTITEPIDVNILTQSLTVGAITNPVNVNINSSSATLPISGTVSINSGTVAVSSITNPVDVNLITKSVTVGAITNPVNVNINSSSATLPISGTVSANITNATVPISGTVNVSSGSINVNNIVNPVNVNLLTKSVTVSAITNPVDVNINSGTVAVSSITNPVDVNLITKSVTVGAITNPVNVNINSSSATIPISGTVSANITNATVPISGTVNVSSGSINVNNILNPVNVNLLTKSVTVSAITNPVAVNINSGTVAVSSITNPVNINTITKAVTVGAITNPVNVNINSSSATLPISGTVTANISGGSVDIGTISGAVSISTGTVITGTSTKVAPNVSLFSTTLAPAKGNTGTYYITMPNTTDLFLVQIYTIFYVTSTSPDQIEILFNGEANNSSYPEIVYLNIYCTNTTMSGGNTWFSTGIANIGYLCIQFQVAGIHDLDIFYTNNSGNIQTYGAVPVTVYVIDEKQSNISLQF